MKLPFWITPLLTTLFLTPVVQAENINHTAQLLSSGQCPNCDLSYAGLVMSNLTGVNLEGANLTGVNLSRSNLQGANLNSANLAGANLVGANLAGANLLGANLAGADLRGAYLYNANLLGVNLEATYLQGAVGIPDYAGDPKQFYAWGAIEFQGGHYYAAIDNYNKALTIDPTFAPALLGRGLSRYRLGDTAGAMQDVQSAKELFTEQKDEQGLQMADNFIKGVEMAIQARNSQSGGMNQVLSSIGSLLLRFLLK